MRRLEVRSLVGAKRPQFADVSGRRLRAGDYVRVVGVPNLAGMNPRDRQYSDAVFRHLRGTCKRIAGFDQWGNVELFFRIRRGPLAGVHSVGIEPWLLRLQPRRPVD